MWETGTAQRSWFFRFRRQKKHYLPTHIHIRCSKALPKDSVVLAEQIRTIDRYRLKSYVGSVDFELMEKVEKAMKISIGVDFDD